MWKTLKTGNDTESNVVFCLFQGMNKLCNSTLYWMFDNADGRIERIFIKYDDWTTVTEMTELPMHRLV